MDIEKTIEFILKCQADAEVRLAKHDVAIASLEALTASNAEDIKNVASLVGTLAQRMIETDERISKLVSAIGEFMRPNPSPFPGSPAR